MKPTNNSPTRGTRSAMAAFAAVAISTLLGSAAQAADMYLATAATPGGVPARSTIISATPVGTNTTVCWYGMQGWYTVEASTNADFTGTVTPVGRTAASAHAWCATVPNPDPTNAYFFRLNQNNAFEGSGGCAGCHGDKYSEWVRTPHAKALSSLATYYSDKNPACLPCHTIGFGQPSGYTDSTNTPHLANVGCENCHGPSAWHKYSDHDLIRPAVSIDPAICGGCHDGDHHPTYEEWKEGPHAHVTPDVAFGSSGMTNIGTAGFDRQMQCGACHSAATRWAMLKDYEARLAGYTNRLVLPSGHDAALWGPTCATCHDPHATNNVKFQLRNPMRSTNYYTLPTFNDKRTVYTTNFMGAVTTNVVYYNTTFAQTYDPNVQICAQCHNSRGARWDGRSYGLSNGVYVLTTNVSFARPPHHSPQYNVLVGIVQPDYLTTNASGVATNWLQRHGTSASGSGVYNTNQCATCHVPIYADKITGHGVTGHNFEMNTNGCTISGCHGSVPNIEETQHTVTNGLARVVSLLNQWALAKGTNLFGAVNANRYRENGWEFTTVGALASITNAGPSAADQLKLPDVIKQARFNLYMVLHDGSLGLHNPRFANGLIADAENKVLNQFSLASFRAFTTTGFAPLTVGFTNVGTGVAGYSWDFGDGNTSTVARPTNVYSRGVYSVTLTATGDSGSETVTRPNYIGAYARPTVTFSADSRTGTAPLTVNFSNTSTSTDDVTAWRWTINGQNITAQNTSYTFTNAGNYNVALRASTPAGNVTSTSNAFIVVTAPLP